MTEHDPERIAREEQILIDLTAGDLTIDAPAVVALLADPAWRERAMAVLAVRSGLDGLAADEAAAVAAAAASSLQHPRVARTISALAAGAAAGPAAPHRRQRPFVWGVAAAAAIAVVWILVALGGGRNADDDRTLGDALLRLAAPVALADGGLELSWQGPPGEVTYVVEVFDPERPADPPVLTRAASPATTWRLSPATVAGLTPAARWRVVARVNGRTIDVDAPLR